VRIGIVGAGAIGLTFAAALAGAHDVVLLARRAAVAQIIERDGIALEGSAFDGGMGASATDDDAAIRYVRVRASTDPRALAQCDAVLVAVKAYATADALAPLRGILPSRVLVASLQNGIDNVEIARTTLPGSRVVAGSTMQGAVLLGDGRIRPLARAATVFARDDAGSPSSDDLAGAFRAGGLEASVVDDPAPALWRKLVVNAALNPLGALARRTNGDVVADPDLAPLARALAGEAGAVAAAAGIDVGDPWATVEAAARATAANRNSMLQDLDAGRPTEIEAICGAIARRAHLYDVPVPLTETMLRLVRARERG
jgi:2-dehydropantoate 2-reductase